MDNIYIVRGTEQAGPFTENDIRAQLASGALTGDSLVWWEGLPEWMPISKTPLAAQAKTAVPATVTPAAPAPLPAHAAIVPAPTPIAGVVEPVPGAAKMSVLAVVSLITGILGIPMTFCWILGLPLDLCAIITGHIALVQFGKDPTQTGKGMALAGLICGYLGVVLIIAFFVVIALLGSQVKDIFSTLQSQINAAQAMTNNAPAPANP